MKTDREFMEDYQAFVQEYRKASAEVLGIILHDDNLHIRYIPEIYSDLDLLGKQWNPHIKEYANQREMIEDWMRTKLYIQILIDNWGFAYYLYKTEKDFASDSRMCEAYDKSKSTAFMKAFMEYIKETK